MANHNRDNDVKVEEQKYGVSEERRGFIELTWHRLLQRKGAVIGLVFVGLLFLVAIFAPYIAPYEYQGQEMSRRLEPPSADYWLGTDHLGRDIFSRIVYGSRISLQVGLISVGIALVLAVVLGLTAGYYGGKVDKFISSFLDMLLAFPGLLLALAIVAALGPGLYQVMVAVGIRSMPTFARVIRGNVMKIKSSEYVEAARGLGAGDVKILANHILPNVVAPILVLATLRLSTAVLSAAALSYLGVGAQPPTPDWGAMVADGRSYLRTAWWVSTFPGLAIMVLVMSFNLVGDGLRDALDPRLKQ